MTTLPTNSLGLDFNASEEPAEPTQPPTLTYIPQDPEDTESQQAYQSPTTKWQHRETKQPYVNLDRVKTGGSQRVRAICLAS